MIRPSRPTAANAAKSRHRYATVTSISVDRRVLPHHRSTARRGSEAGRVNVRACSRDSGAKMTDGDKSTASACRLPRSSLSPVRVAWRGGRGERSSASASAAAVAVAVAVTAPYHRFAPPVWPALALVRVHGREFSDGCRRFSCPRASSSSCPFRRA